jgi:hypothetical protein
MDPTCDSRREARLPCDARVTVLWRGQRGEDKFSHAKAIDISRTGLRLEMPEALSQQTYLTLDSSKLGLRGSASVRHCMRVRGCKFEAGVEFTAGLSWVPKE